jgi:hypothetical protein
VIRDLTVRSGGDPGPARLAALAAAASALLEQERAARADPVPAAHRSRWRRAAMIEAAQVPGQLMDDGPPWGVR